MILIVTAIVFSLFLSSQVSAMHTVKMKSVNTSGSLQPGKVYAIMPGEEALALLFFSNPLYDVQDLRLWEFLHKTNITAILGNQIEAPGHLAVTIKACLAFYSEECRNKTLHNMYVDVARIVTIDAIRKALEHQREALAEFNRAWDFHCGRRSAL